jgi:MFS transporter, DHA1 family, multidrug resistance protein
MLRTIILGTLTAFAPMAIDMYLPSLPAIGRDLGGGAGDVGWTLSAFMIAFGLGQLAYGPLSDLFGRKPPIYAGAVLFVVASFGCASAGSIAGITIWRLAQGFGAAAGPVVGRAMVRDLYERDEAARMLSMMAMVTSLAPLLAPILGGWILGWSGWRAIFVALAAFGVIAGLAAALGLPESHPRLKRMGARRGGVVRIALGLGRERRFAGYAFTGAAMFSGYFAFISATPYVFIEVYKVTPQTYSVLFGISVIGLMLSAWTNGRLLPRFGSDRMLLYGTRTVAVAGLALLAVGASGFGGLPLLVAALVGFICCMGLILPNAMAGALALYPRDAGSASAVIGALQFGLSAAVGAVAGHLFDGSALPMTAIMAGCGLTAAGLQLVLLQQKTQ